ncbi:alpha/beta hydrolase [Acinetobacter proteolyticus]|uniref:alpha/beta hydrolase n=1 Tax=Acinetobacter proteolyticus TaxID=1776741 RepID=UPI003D9533D2
MKNISILLLIATLSGCAGLPSIPPDGYSKTQETPPLTTRVAFDQLGEIYPISPPFKLPGRNKLKPNINSGFSIREHFRRNSLNYNPDQITFDITKKIVENSESTGANSKIIFLIHGFNNSFYEAKTSLELIKDTIEKDNTSKNTYVEVYWDGLHKGVFSFKSPNFYWQNALTNSNFAGEVGLRNLLNKLPDNTDLYFITHSRGAAVVFSAFTNPIYDPNIKEPNSQKLALSKFNKVRIVSFAPAIGTGHFSDIDENIKATIPKDFPQDTKVFLGFNSSDRTLKKFMPKKIGERLLGSTKLGYDNSYYKNVEKIFNTKNLWIQRQEYTQKKHGLKEYFGLEQSQNRTYTNCILWASSLIKTKPRECSLTQ